MIASARLPQSRASPVTARKVWRRPAPTFVQARAIIIVGKFDKGFACYGDRHSPSIEA
jgi:hypothetical protein